MQRLMDKRDPLGRLPALRTTQLGHTAAVTETPATQGNNPRPTDSPETPARRTISAIFGRTPRPLTAQMNRAGGAPSQPAKDLISVQSNRCRSVLRRPTHTDLRPRLTCRVQTRHLSGADARSLLGDEHASRGAMVKFGARDQCPVRRARLRGRADPPRLDRLAVRPILHLPGMFEDVPGDPAGRVGRCPAVGHHG
jgi:hypothetical protein